MINSAAAEACINFTLKRIFLSNFFRDFFREELQLARLILRHCAKLWHSVAMATATVALAVFTPPLLLNWVRERGERVRDGGSCQFHESNMTKSCYLQFPSSGFFCAHMCAVYFTLYFFLLVRKVGLFPEKKLVFCHCLRQPRMHVEVISL